MTPDPAAHIVRRSSARPSVWGDEVSGQVSDLVYGRPDPKGLYLCHSTLGAGKSFSMSADSWPVSEGWNAIHVLRGSFLALEPFTREIVEVSTGGTLIVPPRVWHFGRAKGSEPVEMLEFIGPPTPGPRREALKRPPGKMAADIQGEPFRPGRQIRAGEQATLGPMRSDCPTTISARSGACTLAAAQWVYVMKGQLTLATTSSAFELGAGDAAHLREPMEVRSLEGEATYVAAGHLLGGVE